MIWLRQGPAPFELPNGIEWEVAYDNELERGKRTTRNFPHPFFTDDSDKWSEITGIHGLEYDSTLHGGGLQVIEPGGYLGVHLDYMHHPIVPAKVRALTVVAFCNRSWDERYGGALTFNRPDGSVWKRILPTPHLCVAFQSSDGMFHGVEKVAGPTPRITLAKSFLLPAGRSRAVFLPNRIGA